MKLWGGRFSKEPNELMRKFQDSLRFDWRLYAVDIQGSAAYAKALVDAGLLTAAECEAILSGLAQAEAEFDAGTFEPQPGDEDIHTAVERRLTELIGDPAGKLHTGRSRNDQVALDMRLYMLGVLDEVDQMLAGLQTAIVVQAEGNIDLLMPGFTHLQPAQPVLFSHWLMSYFWMLARDRERLAGCRKRTAVSPLGAGALAGNPFAVDREALAAELGLAGVTENSMDAVSDRDFVAEFLFAAALLSTHLSRLAEDLILFSNPALGYVSIDEAYSTGSTLMPQKRNPDSLELARAKSGRIIGSLMGLLVVFKGLPSSYDKDLQEDKEGLFDVIDTLAVLLPIVQGVVETMRPQAEAMQAGLDAGMLATDLADYLVEKGVPFRQAHGIVGEVVRLAEERDVPLSALPPADLAQIAPQFESDVAAAFDFKRSVSRRAVIGGTAPDAVRAQIARAKTLLSA
jgi:argininosuccinate lyase